MNCQKINAEQCQFVLEKLRLCSLITGEVSLSDLESLPSIVGNRSHENCTSGREVVSMAPGAFSACTTSFENSTLISLGIMNSVRAEVAEGQIGNTKTAT